jgi:hypothetical protein
VKIPANRFTVFGLIVLAVVALWAVASLSKSVTVSAAQPPVTTRTAVVNTGLRACPAPGLPGSRDQGVSVIAAAAAHAGPGRATISRLSAAGSTTTIPLVSVTQAGTLSQSAVSAAPSPAANPGQTTPGKTSKTTSGKTSSSKTNKTSASSDTAVGQPGGVMVSASGSMAQGLAVEQTASSLATASCGSPGTDFWFAAPGQQAASTIKLYLMNVDDQASDVNVDIVTDTGPLQGGTDTGITVPPHGLVVQSLSGLLHNSRAIGLHVRTSLGRVVAALNESTSASQPGGWLAPVQPPAQRLVIPGMPASSGSRQLYVTDPGGNDAAVTLSVANSGGMYQPTGATAIDIPAGSASKIELPSLGGISGAAVLTSNVPVTASIVAPGGPPGAPGALIPSAPAIEEQGVVADVGQTRDSADLVLSAPSGAARVRMAAGVSGFSSAGGAGGQVITISAKHSVVVHVTRPAGVASGAAFAIVLTPLPGSGPVYAGRVLTSTNGTVFGVMPIASALTAVPLPGVRDSLMTVAP